MTERNNPSPKEQLHGICHGILEKNVSPETAFEAIKLWMGFHLSDEELSLLNSNDDSWCFADSADDSNNAKKIFAEYAIRFKNGVPLEPLPFMKYRDDFKDLRAYLQKMANDTCPKANQS